MPYGPTKFVRTARTLGAQPLMTQVIKDDIKVIVPREYREAEPIFPLQCLSAQRGRSCSTSASSSRRSSTALTTGAVYALIALGLTLIYGVLHIINFAHGAALMLALYARVLAEGRSSASTPTWRCRIVVPGMFALGYALQRGVINRASHGKDENILLVTLGIAIVLENLALLVFKSDTRTIETPYTLTTVAIGPAMIALPKLVAFAGRAGGVGAAAADPDPHRPRPGDPRGGQGKAGRQAHGHRRRPRLRHELRHRPGLPGRGGVLPAAGLLRQPAGRRAASCWWPSRSSCSAAWAASPARWSAAC